MTYRIAKFFLWLSVLIDHEPAWDFVVAAVNDPKFSKTLGEAA